MTLSPTMTADELAARDEREGAGVRAQVMGALRHPLEIPHLSMLDFQGYLGRRQVMEPITEELMRELNERRWREDEHDSPHEHRWHTSFHASEFPGDNPNACQRYLLYRMMNFLPVSAPEPWVTTTGDVGSAGEDSIVRAWAEAGRLLSAHPDAKYQTYFEDGDCWLSASTDAAILKPFWTKPHIVEVKGKDNDVIIDMNSGLRRWDKQHRHQLLSSLGAAHDAHPWKRVILCEQTWKLAIFRLGFDWGDQDGAVGAMPWCREHDDHKCLIEVELDPPDSGSIYYWSRSWPRGTPKNPLTNPIEFFFEHDPHFIQTGKAILSEVRGHFEADRLPPRPDHFMWSIGQCQHCPHKKHTCKPDEGKKKDPSVTKLSESHGVEHTRSLRPSYDPEEARQAVLGRWSGE